MAKEQAAGGVVINDKGEILLRRPTGDYGGYVWTYPKGRVDKDKGETLEETALREVREETGIHAKIIKKIDKEFEGSVTNTTFFIMQVESDDHKTDAETAKVVWVKPERASKYIRRTTLESGRKRDLAVLDEALAHLGKKDEYNIENDRLDLADVLMEKK